MRRMLLSLATLSLVASCGGGDGTTPPTGTPGITLVASASSGTIARGASSTTTLSLGRVDGFAGAVSLTAEGVPTGVTVVFAPQSLTGTTSASTVTISVATSAAAGNSSLTFRGVGTGVTDKTVSYTLTIPAPAITVTVGSASVTAAQGTSATVPVTITRTNGATGAVTLTAEGLPANVSASFSPSPIAATDATSTLTLTVGAGATVTSSTITVRAAAAGVTDQTTTFSLAVTSAATPAYTLSAAPAAVAIVAGQSGQSTLTITKTGGFAGNIALSVEGAPAGMTSTFLPNPATGATTTLTFNTTLATVPGTYNVTVRGTTAGLTDRTIVVAVTVNAVAGITVTLAPTTLSIAQGTNAQTAVTLVRLGGLTGDLQMTATGMPIGMTVGFVPPTVTGTASTLTVTVSGAVVAGTYPITVTATGAGAVVGSATLSVTVTTPSGFTLSATGVTIAQGALGTSAVTITRIGGYAGVVDLIASNVPANVAVAFAPASVSGTSSTITFTVGAAAVAGGYTVTVSGTGVGAANQSTTVALTITAAGGGGSIAWRFCDAARVPLWLAYRNGTTGAWTRVTPSGDNTFAFSLSGATGAVAYVQNQTGGGTQGSIFLNTTAELSSLGTAECTTRQTTKVVNGSVTGLVALQTGYAYMGGGTGQVAGPASAFQFSAVADRLTDLLAFRVTTDAVTFSMTADRGVLRRNVNYPAGGTAPVIDFAGGESFPLATATVTVANAGSDNAFVFTTFMTGNGTVGAAFVPLLAASSGALGVPSTHTLPGDFHQFLAVASNADGSSSRLILQYNRNLANRTLTLGGALTLPTLTTTATAPYARLKVRGPWQAEYGDGASTSMTQSSGATARSWTISGSRGYFGAGSTEYEFELQDFSGTAGFLNVWGLATGSATQVSTTAQGTIVGTIFAIAEGNSYKAASRVQTITP